MQLHCGSLMILGGPYVCSKCSQSFWKEWNSLLTQNSHMWQDQLVDITPRALLTWIKSPERTCSYTPISVFGRFVEVITRQRVFS